MLTDHQARLLDLLEDYRVRWPSEHDTIEKFTTFVASQPRCFDRNLEFGHITGSAWLLDNTARRVLLTHHRKLNRWLQLGGHADEAPDARLTALREAEEESGLEQIQWLDESIFDIDVHPIPARGPMPEHFHFDIRFALQARGSQEYVVSEESLDLAWVDIESLTGPDTAESMRRMARKWLAQQAGRSAI